MAPLFSIITVCYNAEATIAPTLASVRGQKCRDFEHIIIDGASTDATLRLVRESRIRELRLLSEPDNGLYDAMNKGLGLARGKYVMFLNAGDSFHSPDTLSHIAEAATANDYPGIIYGQTDIVNSRRERIGSRHLRAPEVLTYKSFANGMLVCHQAFAALRIIASNFDTSYRFSADYDWCIRCLQHSRHNVYLDETLIDYLNEGVTTANHRRSLMERFRIMSHYYGFWPTFFRHFKFLARSLRRNS